ncbi:MAG: hypothetical protein U9R01_02050 [candidate division WOR-3 bacterium]|nr:hypothetical protein [candidate division WOR-3 bacterium]
MLKTCQQCQKEYKATRDTSKYCSPQCRKLAFLNSKPLSVPNNNFSVPQVSVPEIKRSTVKYDPNIHERQLTENEKKGITEYGKCHGCGKEVEHYICDKCFNNNITHENIDIKGCNPRPERM